MVKEDDIEVSLSSSNINYYEEKGYLVPRKKDKKGRMSVPVGTKMIVKVDDLPFGSRSKVTKICDFCSDELLIPYFQIIKSRKKDGKDYCHKCSTRIKSPKTRNEKVKLAESLYVHFPELMLEWDFNKNVEFNPKNMLPFSNKKVWWRCLKCESSYDMDICKKTIEKSGCPFCLNRRINDTNCFAKTHPYLMEEWNWNRNRDIDPYSITYGSEVRVWWKCRNKKCDNEWRAIPYTRVAGSNCPLCVDNYSKQKSIYKYLSTKELNVVSEYRIDECRNKKPLPFDIAILSEEGDLICLIEYDGEQHFKPMKHWGGEKALEGSKKRDVIKNTYCKNNNIPLLRIPYWEFNNAENIIDDFLFNLIPENKKSSFSSIKRVI